MSQTKCLLCQQAPSTLIFCAHCRKSLSKRLWPRTSAPEEFADFSLQAAGAYQEPWDLFLKIAKSQPCGIWNSEVFSILDPLLQYWSAELKEQKPEWIVPVPGQFLRSRLQTDLAYYMALKLSEYIPGTKMVPAVAPKLSQIFSPGQKSLHAQERRAHHKEEDWRWGPQKGAAPKSVLLVDDVCTTGSSLSALARVMKSRGVLDIQAFVLARVESPKSWESVHV